jgi:hypothetical protein
MRLIAEVDMRTRLSLMKVAMLLMAGCVTLTAEQKLSHELFVEAAHECQSRYHTIHVDQIDLEGSLKLHADADSRGEYRAFVACYHDALKAHAEARRKAGLLVPDTLMHEHDVELD